MQDSELVERIRSGDTVAFAALYERYADALYDFSRGILRNPEDAMDAVQDTFVTASTNIDQLRDATKLRPWLYSVARSHAYRKLRVRKRSAGSNEIDSMTDAGRSLEQQAIAGELQELLADAALGLNDQDRLLIDLHLRHDMLATEIASVLGIQASQASVRLSRVKDRVERCLGALLVARRGSEECQELVVILRGWDGRFNPLIRKRVARHIDDCDICSSTRAALVSPVALLSAIPLLAAPAALKETVLGDLHLISTSSPTHASTHGAGRPVTFRPSGYARIPGEMARRGAALLVGISVFLGLAAGGAYVIQDDLTPLAAVATATTTQPTTTSTVAMATDTVPLAKSTVPAPVSSTASSTLSSTGPTTTTRDTATTSTAPTTPTTDSSVAIAASTTTSTSLAATATTTSQATSSTTQRTTTTTQVNTSTTESTTESTIATTTTTSATTTQATSTTVAAGSLTFTFTEKYGYYELAYSGKEVASIKCSTSQGIISELQCPLRMKPGSIFKNWYSIDPNQSKADIFKIEAFAYDVNGNQIAFAWFIVDSSEILN